MPHRWSLCSGEVKRAYESVKGALELFGEHHLTDWAAALTYYGLLAMFPGLIALVSVVGLFGDPVTTTHTITEMLAQIGPGSAADSFEGPVRSVIEHRGQAGVFLVLGLGLSVLSASSYIGGFVRATNVIYGVESGEPFWKTRPRQLLFTLGMIVGAALITITIVLSGPLLQAVADPLGIGGTALGVWKVIKWPVVLVMVVLLFAALYYVTAPRRSAGFHWVTAGSLLAVTIWMAGSAGLALYVSNFGSYDKTYGTLAGLVVLLIWIWLTNVALLLGAEMNAAREREDDAG
jgi:membrane protein